MKGFASAWAYRTPWLGEESGKPVYAAVETSDLAAKLKRGLPYILNEKTTQGRKQRGNEIFTWVRGGILLPFSFSACHPTGNIGFFNFLHRLLKGKQLLLNPLYFVQYLGNGLRRIEAHI